MLLIHPPVVKPSEPPPGIAKLSGALHIHNITHQIIDANIEGLYYLLNKAGAGSIADDTWTRRALHNLSVNLNSLKNPDTYKNMDRYKRALIDINRILNKSAEKEGVRVSLIDYQHKKLSPLRSSDLLYAADHSEENPFYPYFSERLTDAVRQSSASFIGFSLNYLSQALTTFAMMGFIKKRSPAVKIVVGGGLATSWMKSPLWNNPFRGLIDHIIAGPGEAHLLDLLGKKPKTTEHYLPRYDSLVRNSYLSPGFILPYSTSSGCYWGRCSFCPERAEGNKYSQTRPDLVADDLRALSEQLKPALIHIVDNAISPAMMKKISEKPPGTPWYGFTRITPHLADTDFCRALKESGCVMIKLGLESGSQEVVDSMNKGIDLKIAGKALKHLKAAGIATYVYLLFGTPAETEASAGKTLNFILKYANCIDFMNIAVFNMPVNSPDAKSLITNDFYEGDLSLYTDFKHPKEWGRRQVRRFLDSELKKHSDIRPILRRNPPFFTSSHAPLLGLSSPPPQAELVEPPPLAHCVS